MSGMLELGYKRKVTIVKARRRRVLLRDCDGRHFWVRQGDTLIFSVNASVPIEDNEMRTP